MKMKLSPGNLSSQAPPEHPSFLEHPAEASKGSTMRAACRRNPQAWDALGMNSSSALLDIFISRLALC